MAHSEYIQQGPRPDATGHIETTSLLKVICAPHQLAYGLPSNIVDDMFDVLETTASLFLTYFCAAGITAFGSVYLRKSTGKNIAKIEAEFSSAGFPGCIGCLDCAGWS